MTLRKDNAFIGFIVKNKHGFLMFYYFVLMFQFRALEARNISVDTYLWTPLDMHIPFLSAFVLPYIAWFAYVGIAFTLLGLKDKTEFFRSAFVVFVGMTLCFVIYYFFPNGQPLRPALTGNEESILDRMVFSIYQSDTPTNSAPSIHVLNSIAVTYGLCSSTLLRQNKPMFWFCRVLNLAIIASTLLIKQHSVIDVILGALLAFVLRTVAVSVVPSRRADRDRERRAQGGS